MKVKFLFLLLIGFFLSKNLLFSYPGIYNRDKNISGIFNGSYGNFFGREYYFLDYTYKNLKGGFGVENEKILFGLTVYKNLSLPFLISPLDGANFSFFFKDKEGLFLSISLLFHLNLKYLKFVFSPGYYFFEKSLKPFLYFSLEFKTSPNFGFRVFSYSNMKKTYGYSLFLYF